MTAGLLSDYTIGCNCGLVGRQMLKQTAVTCDVRVVNHPAVQTQTYMVCQEEEELDKHETGKLSICIYG